MTDPRTPGKKPQRSRLEKLRHSWQRASDSERGAFFAWLGERGELPASHALPETGPIASGRYLTPAAALRIRAVMAEREMEFKDLLAELGLARNDRSLARAMLGKSPLKLSVVAAIQSWLEAPQTPSAGGDDAPDQ